MSSCDTNIEAANSGTGGGQEVITKAYCRRFWILLVFSLLAGFQVSPPGPRPRESPLLSLAGMNLLMYRIHSFGGSVWVRLNLINVLCV